MGRLSALTVVLIKPSRYDDEGHVMRYWRGVLPSNTLACMTALTETVSDSWHKQGLPYIDVINIDDTVEAIPYKKIAKINSDGKKAVAALVGVQSNQFPRAADIALRLTGLGVKCLIGGFHVSGVLSVFKEPTPEIDELLETGITVVQGEAEEVWGDILIDIANGCEKALYRSRDLPDISNATVPAMPAEYLKRFAVKNIATIDCSRGCPFNCSFCTIINVQGKKMRCRSAKSVLATIRENHSQGITQYFFTDDNFSRNPEWEAIFDGIIRMNEGEGLGIKFMMQVDMASGRISGFVEKAAKAGCTQTFIGMESINQKNLDAVGKNQNKVIDYAAFIKRWHDHGVHTHVGYIIGFKYDTRESVRRDIDRLKNEVGVTQASFFILTPLPGSKDHYDLVTSGAKMDTDLNRYDSFHVVHDHGSMSREDCYAAYQEAWESFYEFDYMKKVLMTSPKESYWGAFSNIMWYKNSLLEPNHPMITGFVRLKHRTDVRRGMQPMGRFPYYLRRLREFASGFRRRIALFFELQELWLITRKPDDPRFRYVADLCTTLGDFKSSISNLDFNDYYSKWSEEAATLVANYRKRLQGYYNAGILPRRARKQVNMLLDDLFRMFETVNLPQLYKHGRSALNASLSSAANRVEEHSLKYVAGRRKMTRFWMATWDRMSQRHVLRLLISLPHALIIAVRDLRMSFLFAWHIVMKTF